MYNGINSSSRITRYEKLLYYCSALTSIQPFLELDVTKSKYIKILCFYDLQIKNLFKRPSKWEPPTKGVQIKFSINPNLRGGGKALKYIKNYIEGPK